MPSEIEAIYYDVGTPKMDKSVPSIKVRPGSFPLLSGVDPRYQGSLKNFYGMLEDLDLSSVTGLTTIGDAAGVSFLKYVEFNKRNTSSTYKGFIVRWDSQDDTSDEQIDFVYTLDNGTTWAKLAVWAAGNDITNSTAMETTTTEYYLLVAVEGFSLQTVYWNGSALVAVTSGPGDFDTALTTPTKASSSIDTDYYLRGNGQFRIAYRFYSSTRGVFSAMSDPLNVLLDHMQTTKASGTVYFTSGGPDSGLLVDGDKITIGSRVYEADDDDSITGDVAVDITGTTTILEQTIALADAINGDSSAVVTAKAESIAVVLETLIAGASGNAYALSVTETGDVGDISVSGSTLTGGGQSTTDPDPQCKIVLDLPAHASVLSGSDYDDFAALFDTLEIFRSIDLGSGAADQLGAILYKEQEVVKTGNWATSAAWDALQVSVGTVLDEALPFYRTYDPETDTIVAPPTSGVIDRYADYTFMSSPVGTDGGYNIKMSSMEHPSPEYFTTYNERKGSNAHGRMLKLLAIGDALLAFQVNGITHIQKQGVSIKDPIKFTDLHKGRSLVSSRAVHEVGNSAILMTNAGLMLLNSADGSMGRISAADRLIIDDWQSYLGNVESGYDSTMDTSFFLCPDRSEILMIGHTYQASGLLQGADFAHMTHGSAFDGSSGVKAYFCTAKGRILSPDYTASGSGTMLALSDSYTLSGTITSIGTTIVDTDATYHASLIGARIYMVTGTNAGEYRTITAVDVENTTLTPDSAFDGTFALDDEYVISPVPYEVRWWPLTREDDTPFRRWIVKGAIVELINPSGTCTLRVGGYRNGSSIRSESSATITLATDPVGYKAHINLDGVDVEPMVLAFPTGSEFELARMEVFVTMTDSRKDG